MTDLSDAYPDLPDLPDGTMPDPGALLGTDPDEWARAFYAAIREDTVDQPVVDQLDADLVRAWFANAIAAGRAADALERVKATATADAMLTGNLTERAKAVYAWQQYRNEHPVAS